MATALGPATREQYIPLAVMNDAEPPASDVATLESDLCAHRVRLLIYISQTTDTNCPRR